MVNSLRIKQPLLQFIIQKSKLELAIHAIQADNYERFVFVIHASFIFSTCTIIP